MEKDGNISGQKNRNYKLKLTPKIKLRGFVN